MKAKHTATPWGEIVEIDAFTLGIDYPEGDERDHFLCEVKCGDPDELRANAAFIVRACNAHDDLVNVLKTCADLLRFGGFTLEERKAAVNAADAARSKAGAA